MNKVDRNNPPHCSCKYISPSWTQKTMRVFVTCRWLQGSGSYLCEGAAGSFLTHGHGMAELQRAWPGWHLFKQGWVRHLLQGKHRDTLELNCGAPSLLSTTLRRMVAISTRATCSLNSMSWWWLIESQQAWEGPLKWVLSMLTRELGRAKSLKCFISDLSDTQAPVKRTLENAGGNGSAGGWLTGVAREG